MNDPAGATASVPNERRWLLGATATVGAVVGVATAIPFVASLAPSERAKSAGAPVDVDLGSIAAGAMATVAWRGKPVWILRRTPAMIASLESRTEMLADPFSAHSEQPGYANSRLRSVRPEWAVLIGICTHLGCVPNFRTQLPGDDNGGVGGFYCPCHGSMFDFAGRVYKNVPAPVNLVVPPHRYVAANLLRIGQ